MRPKKKVVATLAIGYIPPSYVKSSDSPSSSLGLNIMKCLHFLVTTSDPVTSRGGEISVTEIRQASIMGLLTFYSLAQFLNRKAPYLSSENTLLPKTVFSTRRDRLDFFTEKTAAGTVLTRKVFINTPISLCIVLYSQLLLNDLNILQLVTVQILFRTYIYLWITSRRRCSGNDSLFGKVSIYS